MQDHLKTTDHNHMAAIFVWSCTFFEGRESDKLLSFHHFLTDSHLKRWWILKILSDIGPYFKVSSVYDDPLANVSIWSLSSITSLGFHCQEVCWNLKYIFFYVLVTLTLFIVVNEWGSVWWMIWLISYVCTVCNLEKVVWHLGFPPWAWYQRKMAAVWINWGN